MIMHAATGRHRPCIQHPQYYQFLADVMAFSFALVVRSIWVGVKLYRAGTEIQHVSLDPIVNTILASPNNRIDPILDSVAALTKEELLMPEFAWLQYCCLIVQYCSTGATVTVSQFRDATNAIFKNAKVINWLKSTLVSSALIMDEKIEQIDNLFRMIIRLYIGEVTQRGTKMRKAIIEQKKLNSDRER